MTRAVLGGLLLVLAAPLASAEANGGAPQLEKVAAGPYLVSVWTRPDPPRIGAIDVSVALMHPGSGAPVTAARGHLEAAPVAGGPPTTAIVELGAGGNRLLYHADLRIPEAGRWRVTLRVAGPAGDGQATFELDVHPASPWTQWLAPAAAALVALGGWLWFSAMRRRPR